MHKASLWWERDRLKRFHKRKELRANRRVAKRRGINSSWMKKKIMSVGLRKKESEKRLLHVVCSQTCSSQYSLHVMMWSPTSMDWVQMTLGFPVGEIMLGSFLPINYFSCSVVLDRFRES